MPVRVWLPPDFERQLVDEADAYRRRVEQVRSQADLATGLRLAEYADAWPDLLPEAAVALASAGVDPLSEAARQVVERQVRTDVLGGPLGELVTPQAVQRDRPRPTPTPQPAGEPWEDLNPIEKVGRGVSNTFGAFARGTMMGLSAPVQELSAAISSIGEAVNDGDSDGIWGDAWNNYRNNAARSELAIAFGELNQRISGDGFQWADLYEGSEEFIGTGVLPGGEILQRRHTDKERLQLDGTYVTPGRLFARTVSDPGQGAYDVISGLVDAGVSVFGDPANYLLPGAASRGIVARGARAAADDGSAVASTALRLLPGLRRTDDALRAAGDVDAFLPRLADTALSGRAPAVDGRGAIDLIGGTRPGQQLVRWLTDETSASRIRELSGRNIPVDIARRLADIDDPAEIIRYLGDEVLGARVRQVRAPRTTLTPDGYQARTPFRDRVFETSRLPGIKRDLNGVRIIGDMPSRRLDPSNPDQMVDNFSDYMRNAKVAEEEWRPLVDRLASIPPDVDQFSRINDISGEALRLIAREATDRGTGDALATNLARQMTRQVSRHNLELRSYAEDRMGNPFGHYGEDWITVGGERMPVPSPMILQQVANQAFHLPDPREIRRAISAWHPITTSTPFRVTTGILDFITRSAWAPMTLLRYALPTRVVSENDARMAFNGLDSAFNHPMRWISWMIGESDGRLAQLAARIGMEGKGGGEHVIRLMEESGALSQRNGFALVGRGDETMPLPARELYNNDVVKYIGDDPVKPYAWAQRLAMMASDTEVQAVARHGVDAHADWLFSEGRDVLMQLNRSIFRNRPIDTPDAARRHARDIDRWIKEITGGDLDLRESIGAGRVLDTGIADNPQGWDSRQIVTELEAAGKLEAMPPVVRGSSALNAVVEGDERVALLARWDAALDRWFDGLLGRWEDKFNRAPAFRQFYASRLEETAAYADQATYNDIVTYASDQLSVDLSHVRRNGKDAITQSHDALAIAQDYAATEVKRLLYDTSRRSQAGDVFRIVFPFLEPWRDVISTWGSTIRRNPIVLERGRQISAQVAHGGDGFFYENDYGESEFRVPVASQLFNWVAGGNERAGVEATGRTLGLNLIGSSLTPGLGPMISLPMSVLLPRKPELEWLENEIFPFGRPGESGEGFSEQVLDTFLPAYLDRFKTALADPQSDRVFAARVADVMRVLAASGDYLDDDGGLGPEAQRRLVDDATRKARRLYMVSAFATFMAPTPTNFRFTADTPTGEMTFNAISREYAALQQEDPTTATDRFIERFGIELAPLMQNRSYATTIRQLGEAGAAWERAHEHLLDYAPNTLGVFAPQYDERENDLDPAAYARQYVTGERDHYGPTEFTWMYNHIIGQSAYYKLRDDLGPDATSEDGRHLLATYRETLRRAYPGYDATEAVRLEMPVDTQIAEIANALDQSSELADTEAGQGIRRYLLLRQAAIDAGYASSGSVTAWSDGQSVEMVQLRQQLRTAGEDLVQQFPDFAVAFDRVFSREFRDDDPATATPTRRQASIPRWLQEAAA